MKFQKKSALAFLLSGALFAASCGLVPEEESFPAAPFVVDEAPGEYTTAVCLKGDVVLTTSLDLKSVAKQKMDLSFSVTGEHIDSVFVAAGENVTEGQLLAQLDISSYDRTMRDLELQAANYELQLRQNEENRELSVKRANLQYADSYTDRVNALEQIHAQFDRTKMQLEDGLTITRLRIGECDEEIKKRQVFAPFDGVVTYTATFTPETESTSGRKVVTIADSTTTLFRASTIYWPYFKAGLQVPITVDDVDYIGTVETEETLGIDETKHKEGSNGYVYIVLDSPAFDTSDSKSLRVEVELDRRNDCLMVPIGAIDEINGKPVVYYPGENDMKCYREVETGLVGGNNAEILSGLSEGDIVIIN